MYYLSTRRGFTYVPEKLERCVKEVMAQGRPESSAWAICQSKIKDGMCPNGEACPAMTSKIDAKDSYVGHFSDAIPYDAATKTAVSARDGVLEYFGDEIGQEPADRIFRVYRSPATLANIAQAMVGLPVTNEHVSIALPPPTDGGRVESSRMVDYDQPSQAAHIAVQNTFALSDTLRMTIESGKRELSLGYGAELVPHDVYDFEQRDIIPHHVAVVDRGRCGPMCSFIDKLPKQGEIVKLHKAFLDAEGALNLQQVAELAAALPEAIKAVPVNELPKLLAPMQKIIELAKTVGVEAPAEEEVPAPVGDEGTPAPVEKVEDEDPAAKKEEEEKKFADSVAAAVETAVKARLAIVDKAREFLPADYAFADSAPDKIMRDALATDTDTKFEDAELPVAFKLLKKRDSQYKQFGDSNADPFDSLKGKEI